MSCQAGKEGRRKLICATKSQCKTNNEPSGHQLFPMVASISICQVKLSAAIASPPALNYMAVQCNCKTSALVKAWSWSIHLHSIILNSLDVKTRGLMSSSAHLAQTHTAIRYKTEGIQVAYIPGCRLQYQLGRGLPCHRGLQHDMWHMEHQAWKSELGSVCEKELRWK